MVLPRKPRSTGLTIYHPDYPRRAFRPGRRFSEMVARAGLGRCGRSAGGGHGALVAPGLSAAARSLTPWFGAGEERGLGSRHLRPGRRLRAGDYEQQMLEFHPQAVIHTCHSTDSGRPFGKSWGRPTCTRSFSARNRSPALARGTGARVQRGRLSHHRAGIAGGDRAANRRRHAAWRGQRRSVHADPGADRAPGGPRRGVGSACPASQPAEESGLRLLRLRPGEDGIDARHGDRDVHERAAEHGQRAAANAAAPGYGVSPLPADETELLGWLSERGPADRPLGAGRIGPAGRQRQRGAGAPGNVPAMVRDESAPRQREAVIRHGVRRRGSSSSGSVRKIVYRRSPHRIGQRDPAAATAPRKAHRPR